MIQRNLASQLELLSRQYPVVTVTGPRQSGKTTLVRAVLPDWAYVSLETPDVREYVLRDPRGFIEAHPEFLNLQLYFFIVMGGHVLSCGLRP